MFITEVKNIEQYLESLIVPQTYPAVTVLLNTQRRWRKSEKAKIKLRNIVNKVEKRLNKGGLAKAKVKKLVEPLKKLDDNEKFWQNTSEGLAIFISKENSLAFYLPRSVDTRFYVSNYFNLKRIAQYIFEKERYYILAVSENDNNFYEGESKEIKLLEEVSHNFPENLDKSSSIKEGEKFVQFHKTKTSGDVSGGGPAYHGHGAYKDGEDIYLRRYLEKIDNVVTDYLADKQDPLVLICTDAIFSMYKKVNNYPHLLKDYVGGNPDNNMRAELLKKVQKIIGKERDKKRKELKKIYKKSYDNKLTNLNEIIRAAYYGNIRKLLVGSFKDIWGRYDMISGTIIRDDRKKKDSEDLVNLAVLYTIKNDGEVYSLDNNLFSGGYDVGAISRY